MRSGFASQLREALSVGPRPQPSGEAMSRSHVHGFILDIVTALENRRTPLLLSSLGHEVVKHFGGRLWEDYGTPSLAEFVEGMRGLNITGEGARKVVIRTDEIKPKPPQPVAIRTSLDLRSQVHEIILRQLATETNGLVRLTDLGQRLHQLFPNEPVHNSLGHSRLKDLIESYPDLTCVGTGPDTRVCLAAVK